MIIYWSNFSRNECYNNAKVAFRRSRMGQQHTWLPCFYRCTFYKREKFIKIIKINQSIRINKYSFTKSDAFTKRIGIWKQEFVNGGAHAEQAVQDDAEKK